MASDDHGSVSAEPEATPPPAPRKTWRDHLNDGWRRHAGRTVAAVGAIALLVGFGGGVVAGKTLDILQGRSHATVAGQSQGFAWPFFGKPRGANAPRAGIARPEGFAVWRSRVDTSGPEPLACVQMSRPLDPSKSYGDFVLVSPDLGHAPAVSVKGSDELCVGGLGFTDRRVTLLKGLPGKGSDQLSANADVDFTFGEKPPYVGFAGDGVILPREESDGVAIETVNVEKLQVEVWRVVDRNLVRKSISAPDPTADGEYASDYGDDSPEGEGKIVWKGELTVKGDPGQRAVTVFPLGAVLKEMKPGGYVIKARDASGGRDLKRGDSENEYDPNPPAQARRWIMFTDMAVIGYTGSEALDVVVRNLKTAKTLPGLRVALVGKNGEDLGQATTDASGHASFPHSLLTGEDASAPKMVMAYGPQGDLAVLDLDRSPVDLSSHGVGGRTDSITGGREAKTAIDSYVYADRGIYRPGETVHVVAMIRDREAKAVNDRKGALVIRRPSGVEFKRIAFDHAEAGAVTADVALPKSAPRGHWTAKLEMEGIDEAAGSMTFSVEDFAPQRLAVTVAGQAERPLTANETRHIDVNARFLYGAPGAGLQVQGEARIKADPNPFPQYKDYRFGDDTQSFEEAYTDLSSTVTDGAGHASLAVDSSKGANAIMPLMAAVTASVFEPGGRPVREDLNLKIRPKPLYLGVKIDQDSSAKGDPTASFDIIAVDPSGRRVAAQGVRWTLIAENWDYDWFQQNGRWQWRRTSRDVVVDQQSGNISPNGGLRHARRLGWGDYRLVVEGPDGAKAVVKFAAGWGGSGETTQAPDYVRVSAGVKTVAQGDGVDIAIKAPYAGEAQVAVATDRLIDLKTISVPKGGTTVHLKTTAAWGGGAYVLVTVVQPRDPVATPKPRRALGLVYVPLDPGKRKLAVDLGTPDKQDAKAQVTVPVQVHGLPLGQRAHVTVAAVDEGILRLTKQESPDPAKWYFGKKALTVDYRDDYGRLLDPNMGAPANVNFGGDEVGGEGLTVTPIKTVALWSGVVETGFDGKATVKLPAAAFNGELRLMAVAWTDSAVGSAAKPMTVREPVVTLLDLPRFLAPGDQALATLELHNVEGKPGAYTAIVSATNGLLAPFRKVYDLILGQRIADHVPLTAPSVAGIGKVALRVEGPGFTTGDEYPLETRLGWGPQTRTYTELQQPGAAFTPDPQLMAGLAAGSVSMQVSYSPFKGFDPAGVALSLSRYPYGCTEQLVSTAYPLLYAAELASDPKARRSSAALNEAVGKLLDRQSMDGAFGLWRVGDGEADAWLGAYATDFLVEAKAQGAPVPDVALERALAAMRQVSQPTGYVPISYKMEYPKWWSGSEDASKKATERMRARASAYALYVLAKAGKGDLARLRWWHDLGIKSDLSPIGKAQLGAGLAMMGDHARARDSLREAAAMLGYRDDTDWYQSPLRDLAAVIAYAYEAGEPQIARELQNRLDGAVRDPDSLNTQEQARLLQAAHQMLKVSGQPKITATGVTPMATAAGTPRWAVGRLADARFVNNGGPIWRTVTVRGTPTASPAASANGVAVTKTLFTMTGAPVNPASLRQGDRVVVKLSGVSRQGRSVMMVVDDALPAGFEIETTLGPDDGSGADGKGGGPFRFLGALTNPGVQEARDDRYVAAMSVGGGKTFTLAYVARAVTPGSFYLPGAEARDMYRPQVFSRTAGGRAAIAAGQ